MTQNDDIKQKLEAVKVLFDLLSDRAFIRNRDYSTLNLPPVPQTFQLKDTEKTLPSRLHNEDSPGI
jgi:hypothetical protein